LSFGDHIYASACIETSLQDFYDYASRILGLLVGAVEHRFDFWLVPYFFVSVLVGDHICVSI
jgi:hypothetical protein